MNIYIYHRRIQVLQHGWEVWQSECSSIIHTLPCISHATSEYSHHSTPCQRTIRGINGCHLQLDIVKSQYAIFISFPVS